MIETCMHRSHLLMRLSAPALALSLGVIVPPAFGDDLAGQSFDCLIAARSVVKLGAPVAGVVHAIFVDRGDHVTVGQPVFELQSDVERAEFAIAEAKANNDQLVAAARAQSDFATSSAERLEDLRTKNAGALNDTQIAQAKSDAQVAENNLRNAELNQQVAVLDAARAKAVLDERTVTSPIDGVVLERTMSPGEYRHDQASVVTLVELDPLYVETYLPKAYFGQIALGRTGSVTLEAPLGTTHPATVSVVNSVIDAASGTFGVRLTLPNGDFSIPAGLRCALSFE